LESLDARFSSDYDGGGGCFDRRRQSRREELLRPADAAAGSRLLRISALDERSSRG
jgi:hypothetical protein